MLHCARRVFFPLVFFLLSPAFYASADDQFQWNRFRYPIEFYKSERSIEIADVIVALQRPTGGWGKNIPPDKGYSSTELAILVNKEKLFSSLYDRPVSEGHYSHKATTLDNGATHEHIRFLMRVALSTGKKKYKTAALKGLRYLLKAQIRTGGWTQNYPNLSSYGGHVTFNDHAMSGAMTALQEAASGKYPFLPETMLNDIKKAIDRGVEYILNAQIIAGKKRTAWCQQHNREDYKPEGGRIYELPSICGLESVQIVKVLMRIDHPNERVKEAIRSAIEWFDASKIEGIHIAKIYDEKYNASYTMLIHEDPAVQNLHEHRFAGRGYDIKVVSSSTSRPIWARFYDIETQHPFFVGWDGIKRFSIDQIDYERRTGYVWYGYWPESLLNTDWPKWKEKWDN